MYFSKIILLFWGFGISISDFRGVIPQRSEGGDPLGRGGWSWPGRYN